MKVKIILAFQLLICLLLGPFFFLFGLFCSKRKFVIGTFEVANSIKALSAVFADSFTVNVFPHPFYRENNYTFKLYGRIAFYLRPLLLIHLLPRASNFIYIWEVGFFSDRKFDFILLRLANKKIITHFTFVFIYFL